MVNPILLLRVIQGLLAFIVLGVAAYVVDLAEPSSDAANFLVFDSVWTFVALGYVVVTPMFFPNFHNRWAVLGVEAITMVFWFAGFIALAVGINNMRCGATSGCLIPPARAAAVFGAFEWLAWATSLALIVHALIQYGKAEPDVDAGTLPNDNTTPGHGPSDIERGEQFDIEVGEGGARKYGGVTPPPRLPELAELGGGISGSRDDEGFYDGPRLDMPEADGFGGRR